jgi:HK97 family phage portal protein
MAISDYFQKIFGRNNIGLPSPNGTQIGGRIGYPQKAGYLANVEHGFNRNPVVAACVGVYASTLNEAPLVVANADGALNPSHPLSLLFKQPNPRMGQAEFWQIVWTYLAIGGNAYIVKVRSSLGNVVELYPYSDAHVAPLLNDMGWIYAYRYNSGNVVQDWPLDDVIHIQNPAYRDPLQMHKGVSPITVAWDKINTYNELQATIYSLVASNAVPSGILSAPGDVPISQVESLKVQLRKRKNASGKDRTDALVLGNGMSYQQMGLDAQRLQAIETVRELETAICGAFRIHPAVVQTSAGLAISTYNNLQSAYAEYTKLTRVPFWNSLEEQIEAGFRKEWPQIALQFDTAYVQALLPEAETIETSTVSQFTNNIITLNEARQALSYDPVDNGDVYFYQQQPTGGFGAFAAEEPEVKAYEDIDFSPPQGVRDEAQKGLDWRSEYGRGGTEIGVARARDLSNGRNISPDTARRMKAYFDRHEIDKQGAGWSPDQDGFPSNGRIAWALWGGDPGQAWANKLVRSMEAEDEREGRNAVESPAIKSGDDVIESVEGQRIKWVEPEAVKYWRTQEDAVKKAIGPTQDDVAAMFKRLEKEVMKAAKSKAAYKQEEGATRTISFDIAKVLNDALLKTSVTKFMQENAITQEALRQRIMELVMSSLDGDLTQVQSFTDQIRDEQIRKMTDMMTESADTTRKDMKRVLEANAGKPAAEVQAALQKKFTELTTSRAKMIATTTCKAQTSVVQQATVKRVNARETDPGRKVVQVWLSQRDDAVRETHEELDGKWIEQGETFDKYVPGAGAGPGLGDVSEAANCRCTLRPVRKSRIGSL